MTDFYVEGDFRDWLVDDAAALIESEELNPISWKRYWIFFVFVSPQLLWTIPTEILKETMNLPKERGSRRSLKENCCCRSVWGADYFHFLSVLSSFDCWKYSEYVFLPIPCDCVINFGTKSLYCLFIVNFFPEKKFPSEINETKWLPMIPLLCLFLLLKALKVVKSLKLQRW